jgi:hypothetical protein
MSPNAKRFQQPREAVVHIAWLAGGLVLGASMAVLLLILYNLAVP